MVVKLKSRLVTKDESIARFKSELSRRSTQISEQPSDKTGTVLEFERKLAKLQEDHETELRKAEDEAGKAVLGACVQSDETRCDFDKGAG